MRYECESPHAGRRGVLRALREAWAQHSENDLSEKSKLHAVYYFGSLQKARAALGTDRRVLAGWSKAKIVAEIIQMHRSGQSLTYAAVRRNNPRPLSATEAYFGSWGNACLRLALIRICIFGVSGANEACPPNEIVLAMATYLTRPCPRCKGYVGLTLRHISPLRWLLLTRVVSLFTSFSFLISGCVLNDKNSNPVARKNWSEWQNVSDNFIARLVFPKEELYFEPNVEDLPRPGIDSSEWANIYRIKRVAANFDDDQEPELAILVEYSVGNCTFCNPVLFAIIDQQSGNPTVAWMTKPFEAHANASETDIFPMSLIGDDKYQQLAVVYDTSPFETGGSYQKTRIIRWNGQEFSEIWRHDLVSHDGGNRGNIPHNYVANVTFVDDGKGTKRIEVASLYATWPTLEEERTQRALQETFVWSEQERRFILLRKHEQLHEKGKTCDFVTEPGRKDISQCY